MLSHNFVKDIRELSLPVYVSAFLMCCGILQFFFMREIEGERYILFLLNFRMTSFILIFQGILAIGTLVLCIGKYINTQGKRGVILWSGFAVYAACFVMDIGVILVSHQILKDIREAHFMAVFTIGCLFLSSCTFISWEYQII